MYLKEETIICDTGNDNVGQILSKKVIKQTILLDKKGLIGISLKFGTYQRRNNSKIKIVINDFSNEKIFYETILECASLDDCFWKNISFPEYIFKNTQKIVLAVSSIEAKINDSVTLMYNSYEKNRHFTIWERKISGSLNLKLTYKSKLDTIPKFYKEKYNLNLKRILYVTQLGRSENFLNDGSVQYRCLNFMQEFNKSIDYYADITHYSNIKNIDLNNYDIFIFHRVSYSEDLKKIVNILDKNKKIFFIDFDDLIFDKSSIIHTSMFKREKKFRETEIAVEGKLKALKLFKRVIVSTDALKLNIRKSHPSCEIVVLHNALNDEWLKKTEIEYKNKEEFRYIGYFCGSHTHDLDFRMCSNSLIKILKENKSLKLLLVGPLNLPENFPLGQVVRYEKTDYLKMGDLIKRCFVTLAPLEDNIFNNCKSSIKFMEAISYGVPCLSSPNQDMVRQEKNGNIVCYSEEDWYHKLNILVEKPSVYNSKIDTFNKNIEENKVSSKVKIFKDYLKNIKF